MLKLRLLFLASVLAIFLFTGCSVKQPKPCRPFSKGEIEHLLKEYEMKAFSKEDLTFLLERTWCSIDAITASMDRNDAEYTTCSNRIRLLIEELEVFPSKNIPEDIKKQISGKYEGIESLEKRQRELEENNAQLYELKQLIGSYQGAIFSGATTKND
ncbi:MAG: hypothetical protein GY793_00950 [Proteobacteria bacterium]|nr:hypothetical protein [Pseudomonadota bacterium]